MKNIDFKKLNQPIFVVLLLVVVLFLLPWRLINWGEFSLKPAKTITVTGEAKEAQANEVASFTAGVESHNREKQTAVDKVNTSVGELIEQVKGFGIPDEDIKTQSVNVFLRDDPAFQGESIPAEWYASNTIEITLRDITKAEALTSLLTVSGATNVYGPNFRIEDDNTAEAELLSGAIENARTKAETMASAEGQKLGKVLNITEGSTSDNSLFGLMEGRGGGAPLEPGTTSVSKSVTVVFELK